MEYLVVSARFNDDKDADAVFASNDKGEAIEAAKDGGSGTVVVRVDKTGNETEAWLYLSMSSLTLKRLKS
ncbi:MAG: hypothetical protein H0U87_11755 [Acidobacteria bacterium]|jgi:hypothetical protein|nr:hypothetical protein [Acidobacteriota bacterium]